MRTMKTMVDDYAAIWPIVALDGVGDLIGDARPGFVAVEGGHRLAFANAAATSLLADTAWGAPLALEARLAGRIARFAGRAAPGEETRELLRFSEDGRPTLRNVVLRRPVDSDDAVIVRVEGFRAAPETATAQSSLAPFVASGGLVALFDGEGEIVAVAGDVDLAEGLEDEIAAILDEADEIAVIERVVTRAATRHPLALVRLGDHADARRLLHLGPAIDAAPVEAPAPVETPIAPAADVAVPEPIDHAPVEAAAAVAENVEPTPLLAAETLEPETVAVTDASISLEPDDLFETLEEDAHLLPPPPVATAGDAPVAAMPAAEPAADEDRFVAAPPLAVDLFSDFDAPDAELDAAWADHPVAVTAPEVPAAEAPAAVEPPAAAEAIETDDAEALSETPALAAEEPAAPLVAGRPIDDAALEDALPEPKSALVAPTPVVEEPVAPVEDTAAEPDAAIDIALAPAAEEAVEALDDADEELADGFAFAPLERSVKFVWQMDADHRFTMVSDELAGAVGPAAADLVGRRWDEVAARLDLDRDGTIAGALARRDTWSGRTLLWPIEGEALRLPVDLAALPAFGRGRTFAGFRGFGTVRAEAPVPDPRAVGLRLAEDAPATALPAPLAAEIAPIEAAPVEAEPVVETAVAPEAVETEALEPPTFPDDCESAELAPDHPIDAAFAGDIGDDPVFHLQDAPAHIDEAPVPPEAEAPTSPVAETPVQDAPAALVAETAPVAEAIETTPAETVAPLAAEAAAVAARVVSLDGSPRPAGDHPRLSVPERNAFRQIAEALGARIEGEADGTAEADGIPPIPPPPLTPATVVPPRRRLNEATGTSIDARLLDRLPVAVALLRDDRVLHANDRFLSLLRFPDLATFQAAGGIDALFAGPHVARRFETEAGRVVPLIAHDGTLVPCDVEIGTVPVEGGSALMLTLVERDLSAPAPAALAAVAAAPAGSVPEAISAADRERIAELQAIVDTATDGVLMLDANGLVLSANTAAEALFGAERRAMIGRPLTERLAPESHRSAMDYLDGLASNGVASVLNDGREVIGRVAPEGLIPLFMTIGRVSTGPIAKYCAVLRDITQWKKSEEELTAARRRAEEASIHKSDFLAKISHEIRTPLNAIIGFSELMMDERFGPIGNERYKDYLRDIHVSGSHVMSLVNDLLDLSKVEAGKMDLRFEAVSLADVVGESVAMMQPQANRERIIIRSSLPAGVPAVVADPRSIRQVVLNLLSNAVKFTPAGGQVIVSTALEDNGEVILRVRDTGYGMSEKELETALEPFRQLHTTRSRSGGTGLGLPLTKALAEANRAVFRIDSTVGQGTLVSITFPVTRVLAS